MPNNTNYYYIDSLNCKNQELLLSELNHIYEKPNFKKEEEEHQKMINSGKDTDAENF